jgi:hypothetical protein
VRRLLVCNRDLAWLMRSWVLAMWEYSARQMWEYSVTLK